MSDIIIIPTVPHTGTMLTVGLFTDLGYAECGVMDGLTPDKAIRMCHIVKDGQYERALRFIKRGRPAVVPIRHPYLVWESWKRRGEPIKDMITAYKRLPELHDLGAYFLPIDGDRDKYLKSIKDALNLPITTSWPIVNGKQSTHAMKYTEVQPDDEIKSLVDDMQDFLSLFY